MRSTWSILAVAGAVLALPAAASAQSADLFSQFQQACVQGNAQPERVRSAAKGWRTVKTPQGIDRAKAWSRDGYTLTSAVQRMDRGERRTCSISGPADPRAEAAAVAWARRSFDQQRTCRRLSAARRGQVAASGHTG